MATFHTAIFTRDGSLGLTVAECATSSAAIVQSVKPGGAAQSRRVKPGDVISKVNGRRVGGYADAARAIASADRPLTLVLERSAQPSRSVTPEEFEVPPETGAAWTKSSLASLPPPPPSPPPAAPSPKPAHARTATVLADFEPTENWHLAIEATSTVDVIKVDSDGWATVRNADGVQGMAPVSYLEIDQPPSSPIVAPPVVAASAPPIVAAATKPKPPPPPPKPKPAPADDAALRQQLLDRGRRLRGTESQAVRDVSPIRSPQAATRPPWAVASTVVAERPSETTAPVESARSSETSVPERRPSGKDRWAAAIATQKSREMERAGSIRGATNKDVETRLAGLQEGHVKRMAAMFAKLLKDAVAKVGDRVCSMASLRVTGRCQRRPALRTKPCERRTPTRRRRCGNARGPRRRARRQPIRLPAGRRGRPSRIWPGTPTSCALVWARRPRGRT